MNKKYFPFTALILLFFSCRQEPGNRMEISGTLKNNPARQAVYLDAIELSSAAPLTLDTIVIEPGDQNFELKGLSDHEGIYRLRFEKDGVFALLVNDAKKINFYADWKDFATYTTSSPASSSMKNLLKVFNDRLIVIDSLRNIFMNVKHLRDTASAKVVADQAFQSYVTETEDWLIQYADSTKSAGVALYALGIVKSQAEPQRLKPLMGSLSKKFANHPDINKVVTDYNNFVQQQEAKILTGKQAPEISLPDTAGINFSLSALRGKYVLVDFWASWCAPCRDENPNVVEAFNKFNRRNFTILGVSLDKEKRAWIKAIKDDKLDWTHISDLKFWNSSVVEPYHIEGIPFNVLVDPQGKIIASNLRGPVLHEKLGELLR
jgi:peroxiredoxin